MPIWPYYNPAELHTQDVSAFQAFEQSNQARAETAMKREKLRREAEDEAIRQQGVMEYQQLVQSGVTPAEAIKMTGGKIFRGSGEALVRASLASQPDVQKPQNFTFGGKRYQQLPGQEPTVVMESAGPTPGQMMSRLDSIDRVKANMSPKDPARKVLEFEAANIRAALPPGFDFSKTPTNPVVQPPAVAAKPTMPKPGDIVKGYRFKGGDPRRKESWEKI
jgi:hypothetical protein